MKAIISVTAITMLVIFGFVSKEQSVEKVTATVEVPKLVFYELKKPKEDLISELNTLKRNTILLKKETKILLTSKQEVRIEKDSLRDSSATKIKKKFFPRMIDKLR